MAISLVLILQLAILAPAALVLLTGFAVVAMIGRPMILQRLKTDG